MLRQALFLFIFFSSVWNHEVISGTSGYNLQDGQGKAKDKEAGEYHWPPGNLCEKEERNHKKGH